MDPRLRHLLRLAKGCGKDLGKFYRARCDEKHRILRYSAEHHCCADPLCEHYRKQQEGQNMPVDQGILQQIVEAFEQLDWVQWVRSQMAGQDDPHRMMAGDGELHGIDEHPQPFMADDDDPLREDRRRMMAVGPAAGSSQGASYARARERVEHYRRGDRRSMTADDRTAAVEAVHAANELYRPVAERIARHAMAKGIDYDSAAAELGAPNPPAPLGSLA